MSLERTRTRFCVSSGVRAVSWATTGAAGLGALRAGVAPSRKAQYDVAVGLLTATGDVRTRMVTVLAIPSRERTDWAVKVAMKTPDREGRQRTTASAGFPSLPL